MSWKCKECGLENSDDLKKCAGCNWSIQKTIVLKTENGQKRFTITTKIGKSFYSKFFDESVCQYIDRLQYELIYEVDKNNWFLSTLGYTKQSVVLNDNICKQNEKLELKTGDLIFIGSRSTSQKIAKVEVEIEE